MRFSSRLEHPEPVLVLQNDGHKKTTGIASGGFFMRGI